MILPGRRAGRVLGASPTDDGRHMVAKDRNGDRAAFVVIDGDFGDCWTVVTTAELAHLRLLGEVAEVYDI